MVGKPEVNCGTPGLRGGLRVSQRFCYTLSMSAPKFDVSGLGELNLNPAGGIRTRPGTLTSDLRITVGSSSAIFGIISRFWRIALALIPRLATTRWANSVCHAWPKAVSTFRLSKWFLLQKTGLTAILPGFLNNSICGASLHACLRLGSLARALSPTRQGGTEAFRENCASISFPKPVVILSRGSLTVLAPPPAASFR
jgi:hypothetical protein